MNKYITKSNIAKLSILAVTHAIIDAASAVILFAMPGMKLLEPSTVFALFILYNGLAFALQVPLGYIADIVKKPEHTATFGCLLAACAFIPGMNCVSAIIIVGIGNSLFHIGGNTVAVNINPGKSGIPGVFIATGSFGVLFGGWISLQGFGSAWIFAGLLVICGIAAQLIKKTPFGRPTGLVIRGNKTGLIIFLILISVAIRSFIGLSVAFPWKTGYLLPLALTSGVFLGKAVGGFVADRFGWLKISVLTLVVSSVLIFLGIQIPLSAMIGVMLFNVTMPVTLVAVTNLLPKYAGFSLGLTTLSIFIGFLLAVTDLKKFINVNSWLVFAIIIFSSIMIYFALKMYDSECKTS